MLTDIDRRIQYGIVFDFILQARSRSLKTMTIRNIPDDVAAGLAGLARQSHRSANAFVLDLFAGAMPGARTPPPKADFSAFCGLWRAEEADAFDAAVAPFQEVREGDWA